MYALQIWDRNLKDVGKIKDENLGWLLDMGRKLQKDYGAFYRLEFNAERKEVDTCPAKC